MLAAAMVLVRWLSRLTEDWPAGIVWGILVSLVLTTVVGALVPSILLSGKRARATPRPGGVHLRRGSVGGTADRP